MFKISDGIKARFTHSSETLVKLAEKNPEKYLEKSIEKITNKHTTLMGVISNKKISSSVQTAKMNKYSLFINKLVQIKNQRISEIGVLISQLPLPDLAEFKKTLSRPEGISASNSDHEYVNFKTQDSKPRHSALTSASKWNSEGNITSKKEDHEYAAYSRQGSVPDHSALTPKSKYNSEGDITSQNEDHVYADYSRQGSVPDHSALTPKSKYNSEGDIASQNEDHVYANYSHQGSVPGNNRPSELKVFPQVVTELKNKTANERIPPKIAPKPDMARLLHERLGASDNRNDAFWALKNSLKMVSVPNAMFKDIESVEATLVHAPDGTMLPANKITVDKNTFAIATQFPTKTLLENHLKMLTHNNTPILVVLASEHEIETSPKFTPYFSEDGQYGDVNVKTELLNEKSITSELGAKQYLMTVNSGQSNPVNIPVLHVTDWPDKKSIDSNALFSLNQRIDEILDEHHIYNNSGLPVIHCKAGVGRTGQLLAAMAVTKQDTNLYTAIDEIRKSRSHLMVQMSAQTDGLIDLCKKNGKRLMPVV